MGRAAASSAIHAGSNPRRGSRAGGRTRPKGSDSGSAAARVALIDALRGGAVIAMIVYHLGFDLDMLGWIEQDINHDPVWLTARALILGTFLFAVGVSFALGEHAQTPLRAKLTRSGRIAAAALLVTVASWVVFPQSAIYFGTLHAIAVISLVLLVVPRGVWPAGALGAAAIAVGVLCSHSIFDHPSLAWIGLMTHKPLTEDYVPLLPWLGVSLIGYAVAHAMLQRQLLGALTRIAPPRGLSWTGRHSLAIYLLHQPLLLAGLIPLSRLG